VSWDPNASIVMITATRNWFKRNRTVFAIGAGVVGAGYLATQYVVGKIVETRQRMSEERISREKYVFMKFTCRTNSSNDA
jgi:hypothetical protein